MLLEIGERVYLDEVEVRNLSELLKFVEAFAMARRAFLA